MNEAEYRANEAKYLKQIAEAMGYKSTISRARNCFVGKPYHEEPQTMFSPEHNAEQRWKLLEWIHKATDELADECKVVEYVDKANIIDALTLGIWYEDSPPLALILAAIELIDAK